MGKGHRKHKNKNQLENKTSFNHEDKTTQDQSHKLCLLEYEFGSDQDLTLQKKNVEESQSKKKKMKKKKKKNNKKEKEKNEKGEEDLVVEGQIVFNSPQPPIILNEKCCCFEVDLKMYRKMYGDHCDELFQEFDINKDLCREKWDESFIHEERDKDNFVQDSLSSPNDETFVRRNARRHKLCLLLTETISWSLTLLVVEASGDCLSANSFSRVRVPCYHFPRVGFGSLESKCYVLGGDVYPDGISLKEIRFPRKVFVCDLSQTVKSWEEGPMLNGGKPNPIVVTVKGKLYALAGKSKLWKGPCEKITDLFEVFEPENGMWRVLPEPPFFSLYGQCFPHPRFRGNTVIGSVIYVQIGDPTDPTLYSFNVDSERWTEYSSGSDGSSLKDGSNELVIHNLRVAEWYGRADVIDYLMFRTSDGVFKNLTVFAYDLSRNIVNCEDSIGDVFRDGEENSDNEVSDFYFPNDSDSEYYFEDTGSEVSFDTEEGEDNIGGVGDGIGNGEGANIIKSGKSGDSKKLNKYKRHNFDKEEYVLMVDDDSVTVPVLGLTHIDRRVYPTSSESSFVTHLVDTLFALVLTYPYRSYDGRRLMNVRVCTFEISLIELSDGIEFKERYAAGHNVREAKWVEPGVERLVAWCKVPNDGHQCQFRRPQLQYGTNTSSYPDYVAGQIVEKKNTFHRYVRRVNLPRY